MDFMDIEFSRNTALLRVARLALVETGTAALTQHRKCEFRPQTH
jgi:hypothetical protein